jgi:small subunit ribosomal protein S17
MSKRILKGKVVSVKMTNTIVVAVETIKPHPKYQKRITVTKKYKAHYTGAELKAGDRVLLEESRPISKDKHWVVKEKI